MNEDGRKAVLIDYMAVGLPVRILIAQRHQVEVALRDRQKLMLAFHSMVGNQIKRRHLLMPFDDIRRSLHDCLIILAPTYEVLTSVTFETKLI